MLAFLQARRTSTRLPDKIYKDLNGAPVLYHAINRAKVAGLVDDVIIVSPHELPDVPEGVDCFVWREGSESDVLGRFHAAANLYKPDYVVRLTADCPLLDPHLIDYVVDHAKGFDYCSNVLAPTFPDGVDVEVVPVETLTLLNKVVTNPYHREHVFTMLRGMMPDPKPFKFCSVESAINYSHIKISVDTKEDLEKVRALEPEL